MSARGAGHKALVAAPIARHRQGMTSDRHPTTLARGSRGRTPVRRNAGDRAAGPIVEIAESTERDLPEGTAGSTTADEAVLHSLALWLADVAADAAGASRADGRAG